MATRRALQPHPKINYSLSGVPNWQNLVKWAKACPLDLLPPDDSDDATIKWTTVVCKVLRTAVILKALPWEEVVKVLEEMRQAVVIYDSKWA